jgi:hypothetical protein
MHQIPNQANQDIITDLSKDFALNNRSSLINNINKYRESKGVILDTWYALNLILIGNKSTQDQTG